MCLCACERRKLPQSLYTYIYVVCSDGRRARDPSIYAYVGREEGCWRSESGKHLRGVCITFVNEFFSIRAWVFESLNFILKLLLFLCRQASFSLILIFPC